jgi:uncharacterized membrane protein YedE/YeeE
MNIVIGFFTGVVFSIGLSVAGMVNPRKVIGYLDFFGEWDPSLMFVMFSGVTVNVALFNLILKRKNPIFAASFSMPTAKDIDKRLMVGSGLFGIGWGLGGVCPGPGLANLFTLNPKALVFCLFMVIGMFLFKWVDEKSSLMK